MARIHQHDCIRHVGLPYSFRRYSSGPPATALESADVLLMADDLSQLPKALDLAKRARRIVRQNLIFAFSVIRSLIANTIIPCVSAL